MPADPSLKENFLVTPEEPQSGQQLAQPGMETVLCYSYGSGSTRLRVSINNCILDDWSIHVLQYPGILNQLL